LISSIFQAADVNNRIFRSIEMKPSKEHFRHLSLYFFNKKKTAADSHQNLRRVFPILN